jgi:hypothetical protein
VQQAQVRRAALKLLCSNDAAITDVWNALAQEAT